MKQEIKEYICKYCGEIFVGTRGGFSNHLRFCKMNPNQYPPKQKYKEVKQQTNIYKLKCKLCGKEYELELTESQYNKNNYSKFCSRSCANTRKHTIESKQKISDGLHNFYTGNTDYLKYKHWLKKSNELKSKNPYYIKDKEDNYVKYYHCGSKELNEKYPEIGCRQSKKWFNKLIPFGFDITSLGSERIIEEFYKCKELLYNEYVINKLSPADIYIKYNCSKYINHSETLLHVFKDWGFNTRSYSDAVKECFLQGKLDISETGNKYQYKHGWHTTWNNKEVYYRSQNELDYAIELDNQQIDYEMEFLHIKYYDTQLNEYRCAIPDFYIPTKNEIVEIKSSYTLDIQNMKDKFKAYKELGYNCKCICDYKEIQIL